MQPEQMYGQQSAYGSVNSQQKQRKIIGAIIILGVLLIIVAVLSALLSSPDQSQKLGLVSAKQAEVVRLIDEYGDNASSAQARDLLARTSIVYKSDILTLQNVGISPTSDQTLAATIPGIDEVMQDAVRSNSFDQKITEYIETVAAENKSVVEEVLHATDKQPLKGHLETILANYENLL